MSMGFIRTWFTPFSISLSTCSAKYGYCDMTMLCCKWQDRLHPDWAVTAVSLSSWFAKPHWLTPCREGQGSEYFSLWASLEIGQSPSHSFLLGSNICQTLGISEKERENWEFLVVTPRLSVSCWCAKTRIVLTFAPSKMAYVMIKLLRKQLIM